MTIAHSIITDPNIHEPKDITSATVGQTYVADGVGSGDWSSSLTANNEVIINSASDFPTPAGGEIQLEDGKTYIIGANVTITDSIRLGVANNMQGGGTLESTNVNGLFLGGDFGVASLNGVRVACATGPLFTLTDTVPGSSILSLTNFSCLKYKSVGTFTDLLGVQIQGGQFLDVVNSTNGMVFSGTSFSVISVREILMVTATGAGFIGIDLGTSISTGMEIFNVEVSGIAGTVGLNGAAASANIPTGILASVSSSNLQGAAGLGTSLTGIVEDDIRWNFSFNTGITDTYPDGLLSMVGNATSTTISGVNTPTLVAGTFTIEETHGFLGTAAGRLTYIAERPIRSPMSAAISLEPVSGTNKDLRVYIAINGTEVTGSGKTVRADNSNPLAVTVIWQQTLVEDDYIEIFVENTSDAVDILVTDAVLRLR